MDVKDVSRRLLASQMIPVFYHGDVDVCTAVIKACYEGGVRAFEYTNRGENALAVFVELKKNVAATYPDMLLGAGSILSLSDVESFTYAQADFIVSPFLNEKILRRCQLKNVYAIPGCMTLTEIAQAEEWGAELIKLFPGSVLGPEFVSAVRGPMPKLKLMPTGGVLPLQENLTAWFQAGVVCVGMGAQLLKKETIDDKRFDILTEEVKKVFSIIHQLQSQ